MTLREQVYASAYGSAYAKQQLDWMAEQQGIPNVTEQLLSRWANNAHVIATNAVELHAERYGTCWPMVAKGGGYA